MRDQLGDYPTMVEPTCGVGGFLVAALDVCKPKQIYAMEQDANYVRAARRNISRAEAASSDRVKIRKQNFFDFQWDRFRDSCGERVLIFGNPPWVTSSEIGVHSGDNLPKKRNVLSDRGIDAITGKSNFDLAESMLQTLLGVMRPGKDSLAMLVKSSTARRLAQHAWSVDQQFAKLHFYQIDAKEHFGASVEAGLLLMQLKDPGSTRKRSRQPQACRFFQDLRAKRSTIAFGNFNGKLVSDPVRAKSTEHLVASEQVMWRSGVKHDLASVLELVVHDGEVFDRNGKGLDIEFEHLYPLAKGSDVASGEARTSNRVMLLPQRSVGQSTSEMKNTAPKTFHYLTQNLDSFNARRSSIYRGRDQFAIFGVGDYTFSPWKVAICGLYKKLTFTVFGPAVFGPVQKKPVVFDDTVYLLPLKTRRQALLVKRLLESEAAEDFLESRIFWEAKRPINASVLRSLDLGRIASEEGLEDPTL
ncbi:hypothetical protein LF1_22560 [Rubripirellula obstinata]|uniref:Uncharacterized protein n=2 Tax=Rubripirellula obstinata TaxID=406547 RepID=A0A5B1CJ16_9BACT|nr:hypothetical protein LF1_22560 [Rubripirellula obstinata]